LIDEGKQMDAALAKLHQLKFTVDQAMLSRRKDAGVWAEKGRRAAARGDIKMPTFSGSSADRLTVYEFEKEWRSYRAAVNYSVEEALKELKLAVVAPARSAVEKLGSEEAIFKFLKAHHGNPVLLLSAREAEIRSWSDCRGTDQVRREWLIHAKNRLEATVALCKEHNIEKYLHFSSVAGIVQSKLPYDMTRDFKKILVKHLSPSGVLEKELVIGLLIDFLDEKILDCTLGVNTSCFIVKTILRPKPVSGSAWSRRSKPVAAALPWARSLLAARVIGWAHMSGIAALHFFARRGRAQVNQRIDSST
jgi:hypothetical protein